MVEDIVPSLLKKIKDEFNKEIDNNEILLDALILLRQNQGTYKAANKYALELGKVLSKILQREITQDILPDGKMYFNIIDRILRDVLGENYQLVSKYSMTVQNQLNKKANIGLKVMQPEFNESRVKGLIDKISNDDDFSKVTWLLGDSIENFTQNIVDDFVKLNVDFHGKVGMKPKIRRSVVGKCCDWCEAKAGTFDYPVPDDFYYRHRSCDCLVEYFPGDGRVQNSHTKRWRKA